MEKLAKQMVSLVVIIACWFILTFLGVIAVSGMYSGYQMMMLTASSHEMDHHAEKGTPLPPRPWNTPDKEDE